MPHKADGSFFDGPKPSWSKYKDLILDYYLGPYLAKVATIGGSRNPRPIALIDCFAGAGAYGDGSPGSPLIIAKHLRKIQERGIVVNAMFIESDENLFKKLQANLVATPFALSAIYGSFQSYVDRIDSLAREHTVFLYVDPFRPGQLKFNDLSTVYDRVRRGTSVETLVNFMSTNFVRRVQGARGRGVLDENVADTKSEIVESDRIAGGNYWRSIIECPGISQGERIDRVAHGYSEQLRQWFDWVLRYAVREKYQDEQPKYHLIFGSRHSDAVDIMNRAMVKARREFVGAQFVDGMLFENQPAKEVVDSLAVQREVMRIVGTVERISWKLLRAYTTVDVPGMYTDSEINAAIKHAIKSGKLRSTATGTRTEEDADVWCEKRPAI